MVDNNMLEAMAGIHRRYLLTAHAFLNERKHYLDASGAPRPVDEQFLREVEATVDVSSMQADRFRMQVMLSSMSCTEEAAHDPLPLQNAVRRFCYRRIPITPIGQCIKQSLRSCWVQLRYTGIWANPIDRVVRAVARQKAFRLWLISEAELGPSK
jgi:hypothetical protein